MDILETQRLVLRRLCADDSDFMLELLNAAGPVTSYQRSGFGLYLVALKETEVAIGICGLLKREWMQDIEIDFAFLERFWTKGYAWESAAAVMDYARNSVGLKRIAATTAPGNRGSIRVLEKLALRFEGKLQVRDKKEKRICMRSRDESRWSGAIRCLSGFADAVEKPQAWRPTLQSQCEEHGRRALRG